MVYQDKGDICTCYSQRREKQHLAMVSLSATSRICANVPPPTSVSYFTVSLSVLLAIITIPGNVLVCLAIIKDPFRNLKTPFNYFLLSLAATDLVVGAIMDPVSVAFHINEALRLNYVDIKILHVLYFILSTASILTLAALTVDRYVAVAMPVKYKTTVTSRRAIVTSVSIWVATWGSPSSTSKLGSCSSLSSSLTQPCSVLLRFSYSFT